MLEVNKAMLTNTFRGIELAAAELAALDWLVKWETVTVDSIISAFGKLSKKTGEENIVNRGRCK